MFKIKKLSHLNFFKNSAKKISELLVYVEKNIKNSFTFCYAGLIYFLKEENKRNGIFFCVILLSNTKQIIINKL